MRLGPVVTLAVFAATAHADGPQDAHAHEAADAGAALFANNDFAGAAAKFREAYDLNHDPSYLFNVAQAYRHAGDCVGAADYYGRFLADVPHPPNEDKIRSWYAAQLQCAKEHAAAPPEPPKQEPPKPEPPRSEPPKPEPLPVTQSDRGHRGLALALAGTGAVALGVGGFFAWDAHYLAGQRDALLARCSAAAPCLPAVVSDYDRRGSRASTIAIVGFAGGALAIAAGATLFVLSRSETAPPVAVAPVRGGAVAGASFTW